MRRIAAAVAAAGVIGALGGQSVLHSSAQSAPSWSQFHSDSTRDGALNVSGPTTPAALSAWTVQSSVSDSPVIASSGIGYIADDAGNVYALNPAKTGTPAWTVKPGGTIAGSPGLTPDGTQLFVGSSDGNVYDLSTTDGTTKWKTYVGSAVTASPLVSPDGKTVYETTSGGSLYALNVADGSVKWKFSPQQGAAVTGAVASPDGSVIYYGVSQRFLYGVPANGPSSGNLATTFYLAGTPSANPAVDQNGNILVPEQEGTLELFAPTGGAARWIYTEPGYQPIDTTPVVTAGLVILGGANGYVYGISEASGVQTWQTKIGPAVDSSPALATGNNRIYIGSTDGGMYAMNQAGSILPGWPFQRNQGAIVGSPALGPDGTVWYAPHYGSVYRVGDLAGPATPPSTPVSSATPVNTSTPVPTSTATQVPTATVTPTPTIVPLSFTLKGSVADGQKQVIKITSAPSTTVHMRVEYPNGDHQSHAVVTNASGTATYTYKQGASKVRRTSQKAKVIAKAGTGAAQHTVTHPYTIKWGKIDLSAEPRSQRVGKTIKFFVHAHRYTRVLVYLLGPSGKVVRFRSGHTGPKGFATFTYKVQGGLTKGGNHKVKVLASFQYNKRVSTSTTFTVK